MNIKIAHRSPRMSPKLSRSIWLAVVVFVTMGCSLVSFLPSTAPADTAVPVAPTTPAPILLNVTMLPPATFTSIPALQTPFELITLQPTDIPIPQPSLTPFRAGTPIPSITVEGPLPTAATELPQVQTCCTLRVWNKGVKSFWIGTRPGIIGDWVRPQDFIEFYFQQPQRVNYSWCLDKRCTVPGSSCSSGGYSGAISTPIGMPTDAELIQVPLIERLECANTSVAVLEGVTEVNVPPGK